jgi:hypothetical protein
VLGGDTSGSGSGQTNAPVQQEEALPTRKQDSKDKLKVKDPYTQSFSEPEDFTAARPEPSIFSEEDLDLPTNKNGSERQVETGHIKIMRPIACLYGSWPWKEITARCSMWPVTPLLGTFSKPCEKRLLTRIWSTLR